MLTCLLRLDINHSLMKNNPIHVFSTLCAQCFRMLYISRSVITGVISLPFSVVSHGRAQAQKHPSYTCITSFGTTAGGKGGGVMDFRAATFAHVIHRLILLLRSIRFHSFPLNLHFFKLFFTALAI